MDTCGDKIEFAAKNTIILRLPKQKLSAFGESGIKYYSCHNYDRIYSFQYIVDMF